MGNIRKRKKRAVQDIPIFLDNRLFEELKTIVNMKGWQYKTQPELYRLRDRALICLLTLTGCRISEILQLRKLQFRIYNDRIILKNVKTVKHGLLREKIILPKKGRLAFLTKIFEKWFTCIPEDSNYIFPRGSNLGFKWDKPLSRKRAFWIIKTTTNKFPHWFRGVCETIYGRIIFRKDAWKLKQFMGLKRLDSTSPYVGGSWEEDEERILEF